jgi:hypothetical protein
MKKKYGGGVVVFLLLAGSVLAADSTPSEKSIDELLEVMNAHQLIDSVKGQMGAMLETAMREASRGKTMTPERQAIIDRMQTRVAAVINDALEWQTLRPVYVRAYSASFSQTEVDGMLKFYKSPAGQAVVKKLPLVLQNVMQDVQAITKPMRQKLQQIQQEAVQELKALPDGQPAPQ